MRLITFCIDRIPLWNFEFVVFFISPHQPFFDLNMEFVCKNQGKHTESAALRIENPRFITPVRQFFSISPPDPLLKPGPLMTSPLYFPLCNW